MGLQVNRDPVPEEMREMHNQRTTVPASDVGFGDLGIQGLGFRDLGIRGLGFRVEDLGNQGLEFRVRDLGLRV